MFNHLNSEYFKLHKNVDPLSAQAIIFINAPSSQRGLEETTGCAGAWTKGQY
jgi:hypothetical protein